MNSLDLNLHRLLLCGLLSLLASGVAAQTEPVSLRQLPVLELDNLVQGRLNVPDYRGIRESPYLALEYLPGNVRHLEHEYRGLPLRYDIFADEVVYLHRTETGILKVQLTSQYIEYFTLGSRFFVNLDYSRYRETGLKSGYYEVVFEDGISLLAKRYADIEHDDAIPYFKQRTNWILVKDGRAYRVRNKKTLIEAMGDQYRKPVSTFLRKQPVVLRKASDAQWSQIAAHLNTLLQSN